MTISSSRKSNLTEIGFLKDEAFLKVGWIRMARAGAGIDTPKLFESAVNIPIQKRNKTLLNGKIIIIIIIIIISE